MSLIFQTGQRILFQGDSITDCGRSREDDTQIGGGYVSNCVMWLTATQPRLDLTFLNRGCSGHRVCDLRERWQADCIDLTPDWVSIMIGINDTWRAFDDNDPTSTEAFEADYRDIVQQAAAIGAKLILCEPFVLPCPPDRKTWRVDLDPRIHVTRDLAREFGGILVPFDGAMNAAAADLSPEQLTFDGVHPTALGYMVMTRAWLAAVGAL